MSDKKLPYEIVASFTRRGVAGLLLGLLLCLSAPAHAQTTQGAGQPLNVGVWISAPFVMKKDDGYTGMAILLWEALAEELGLEYEYKEYPTVRSLVDATANGETDIAVTNLTITRNRALRIDFTQPWYDAGLRVMIDGDRRSGFRDVIAGLADAGFLRAYFWLAGIIVVASFLLTLFDRRFNPDFPKRWRDGVAESFYTVMSVATSGRPPSRKNLFGWVGRMWQGVWLICGIAVIAYVTSTVTSVMTTLSLTNQITGLSDLPGKTVGVFDGSVAEEFIEQMGIEHVSYSGMDTAAEALLSDDIAAVVGDAPVLEYHTQLNSDESYEVVGKIFNPDKYGFALPLTSALTKPLTLSLLSLKEAGKVEELRNEYFSSGH